MVQDEVSAYRCKGGAGAGGCGIDSQSWQSCRSCRFNKCLEAGMAVDKVQKGKSKIKSKKGKEEEEAKPRALQLLNRPQELFTLEEHILCTGLFNVGFERQVRTSFTLSAKDPEVAASLASTLTQRKPIARALHSMVDRSFRKATGNYDDFSDLTALSDEDRGLLFRHTYPVGMDFFQAIQINPVITACIVDQTNRVLQDLATKDADVDSLCKMMGAICVDKECLPENGFGNNSGYDNYYGTLWDPGQGRTDGRSVGFGFVAVVVQCSLQSNDSHHRLLKIN